MLTVRGKRKKQVLKWSHLTQKRKTALLVSTELGNKDANRTAVGCCHLIKEKSLSMHMPARKVFKRGYITDSSIISPDQTVDEAIRFYAHVLSKTGIVKRKRHLLDSLFLWI